MNNKDISTEFLSNFVFVLIDERKGKNTKNKKNKQR